MRGEKMGLTLKMKSGMGLELALLWKGTQHLMCSIGLTILEYVEDTTKQRHTILWSLG